MSELKSKIKRALNIIKCWCAETGLSVSSAKSQMISVGTRRYSEPVRLDGEEIEQTDSIKYLGVVLSGNMKWREHLKLIDEKISKFTQVFGLLKFMNKNLTLRQRKTLYDRVCIPIIAYASRIWLADVRFEYQRKALKSIQRKAMIAVTGCYRRTPLIDMLNLTGTLEIMSQLEIEGGAGKEERQSEQKRRLDAQGYDPRYEPLLECSAKELLWFYTGQGPFNSYLGIVGLAESVACRFCGHELESPSHLVYECARFLDREVDHNEINTLALKCRHIVIEMYKLERSPLAF